ncbi:MAG: DUF87 domain-containing protein [Bdellovibrionales bacterium]|nr:DUF87 domain-containing protein [Bdellovibrionales bacterium]
MKIYNSLVADSVLRIGEVCEVDGRKVFIQVDKNKNLSDIFFDGDILKNISVNSYIEIRKGFLSIIGKVDGEKIDEDYVPSRRYSNYDHTNKNKRILSISLSGYLTRSGHFFGGTKELPLIGNEAFILTKEKLHQIHNLLKHKDDLAITIATSDADGFDVNFPIDGLFNSHIAVFGNTGSGKSNTLASLYQELCTVLKNHNAEAFRENSKFLLLDFNGEYIDPSCITDHKKVYNLSTRSRSGDKIPLDQDSLLNLEILATLSDATEKTQKPFLKRTLRLIDEVKKDTNPLDCLQRILRDQVTRALQVTDKQLASLLMDYFREIIPQSRNQNSVFVDIANDIEWNNKLSYFFSKSAGLNSPFENNQNLIPNTLIYGNIANITFKNNILSYVIDFLYVQLINDLLTNRAQNEHISPAINKLKSKRDDIEKIFDTNGGMFWEKNFVVVNLNDVNLEMKKTVPLLLAKRVYAEQKLDADGKSLSIIIDEAHNILSRESFREEEAWKDYRLETFEEIIKEGRKFGVFVTISSQRPNDISPTITSQAHNYFIHRLINQRDLETISSAVSYIDKITEESIPTLPTGTCIFSGVASQMPLKINVNELAHAAKPKSHTRRFKDLVPKQSLEDLL